MSLICDVVLQRSGFRLQASFATNAPVTGVFGASGCGKSTLLHLVAGLVTPQAGHLELDGQVLYDAQQRINIPPHRRRIGLVFQDNQLFPHLTVQQNLQYGLRLLPTQEQRFSLRHITELLELGPLLQHRPSQLSGGQKQRVALGRALLACPQLLLLDEPLAALDVRLKQQILPFLQRVKNEIQIPMLYVSHAINEILYLTQELLVMDQGRIVEQGRFEHMISKPSFLGLAQSLGLENVLAVEIVKQDREHGYTLGRCCGHELYLPPNDTALNETRFVIIRAASIALARSAITGTSIQNQLPGTVRRLTPITQRVLVEVDIGQPLLAEISSKAAHDLQLQVGETVYCLIKAQSFTYASASDSVNTAYTEA